MAVAHTHGKVFWLAMMLLSLAATTVAAPRDTARVEHRSLWNDISASMRRNPALHGVAFSRSYSEMALSCDYSNQSQAFVQQQGSGHTLGALAVNSFLRMSDQTAAWGSASYTAGRQRDIRWNSTSDYALLAPYVMADTLGGDTHRERYAFSGGYATRLDRVLVGGEMMLRADHEYRDRDPRMRGIVTELTLRAGAAIEVSGYRWGAAVSGSVYKQTNSVDFYNELGKIPEYHMTGLGTEYSRFAGEQTELAYRGGGIGLALNAQPLQGRGAYAHVAVGSSSYERQLTSANGVPLSRLIHNKVEATLGWKQEGQHRWALHADLDLTRRSGDENITGKADSQYYPVIGTLTLYKDWQTDASLGALYGVADGSREWTVSLRTGFRSRRERYVYPERKLNRAHAYATLQGEWSREVARRTALTLRADASHYMRVSDGIVMPYANMTAAFTEIVNHTYRFAKASYTAMNVMVRGDYSLKDSPLGLFALVKGGVVRCSEGAWQAGVQLTAGVTF